MKKFFLCVIAIMVLVCASSAFGSLNDDLLKAAEDSKTTPNMIKNLIKFGADVNAKDEFGWTPLDWAAFSNSNPEVIKTLISAGADINAKNDNGRTPLMSAVINSRRAEVIKTLIEAGADIFAKDNEGKTVLDYAKNDDIRKIILNAAQ